MSELLLLFLLTCGNAQNCTIVDVYDRHVVIAMNSHNQINFDFTANVYCVRDIEGTLEIVPVEQPNGPETARCAWPD